jgi:hypothetical protein
MRWAFAVCTLALVAACAQEKSPTAPQPVSVTISGVVLERLPQSGGQTGLPIRDVKVIGQGKDGQSATTQTDAAGRFSLANTSGWASLSFSKDGYLPSGLDVRSAPAGQEVHGAIEPIYRSLIGVVTDAAVPGLPIAGAHLEITTGSLKGKSRTTDASGAYEFINLWGDFDLVVTVDGYETATLHPTMIQGPTKLDIPLVLDTAFEQKVFTGRLCTIAPPFPYQQECRFEGNPYPLDVRHVITVPRATTLDLTLTYDYVGDYYPNWMDVRVLCGDEQVFFTSIAVHGERAIALPRACAYTVLLSNFIADRKGGSWTTYRLVTRARR